MASALPIIDLSKLDNPETKEEFYKELRHVAKDIGFFYVVGHGIDTKLRDTLIQRGKQFFALPQDEKDKVGIIHSRHFRGYTAVKGERTRGKADYRECIDFGQEEPAIPQEEIGDQLWLNLIGPNQYPEQVPEMKPLVIQYMAAARAVTIKLLRAFLVALEIPEDSLDDLVGGTPQNLLKIARYPGNDGTQGADQSQGVGPHKDAPILTLLAQDDVGGLQVQNLQGEWIDVPPVENSYVINIGETLELMTDGYLIANTHRVLSRPPNNNNGSGSAAQSTERISLPFFLSPNIRSGAVPLLPLPPHLKAQAQGPSSDPENPLFSHVGDNAMKGFLRSLLPVTQRFYPQQYAQIVGVAA